MLFVMRPGKRQRRYLYVIYGTGVSLLLSLLYISTDPGIAPLYIQEGVQNDYRMAAVFFTQG
jgi:hypothetical protein